MATNKAKDTYKIAVLSGTMNYSKQLIRELQHVQPRLRRTVDFTIINGWLDVRGKAFHGYILGSRGVMQSSSYNVALDEIRARGIRQLSLERTDKGPIIVEIETNQLSEQKSS